jgi:CHASE2 domain-containing sensor protein
MTELTICLILSQLDINRYELRFIEGKPLPEALFFFCAGLIVGLLQWTILRRYFIRSGYWILASALGWGGCILLTVINDFAFIPGALIYGAITGATIIWIMRRKEV